MQLETRLESRQTPQLVLTPQMKMSLHVLELPLLELKQYIIQQIEENPVLEEADQQVLEAQDEYPQQETSSKDDPERILDEYLSIDEQMPSLSYSDDVQVQERNEQFDQQIPSRPVNLYEHLMTQLSIYAVCDDQRKIGEAIISNLDENGYLRGSLEIIAQDLNVELENVEQALILVQSFTPAGVGARSLSECLMLQLKRQNKEVSLLSKIVEGYLADWDTKKLNRIARELKVSLQQIEEAFEEIISLEPKPGRSFSSESIQKITPDIIVVPQGQEDYRLELNNEYTPCLRISSYYKTILKDKNADTAARDYLKDKFNQAVWLINALDKRKTTIRNVVEEIFKIQKDFFSHGFEAMKPLNLKEISRRLGVSESTVSRAVSGKYIDTPNGIIPLKNFFNSGVKDASGLCISSESIKAKIEEMIYSHQSDVKLTDEAISKLLNAQDIPIARRTVAKYRKQLRIGSSHKRKD